MCAMDVAIRAVNWLWGFYFFAGSAALTDEFRLTFAGSLLAHGRHIMAIWNGRRSLPATITYRTSSA